MNKLKSIVKQQNTRAIIVSLLLCIALSWLMPITYTFAAGGGKTSDEMDISYEEKVSFFSTYFSLALSPLNDKEVVADEYVGKDLLKEIKLSNVGAFMGYTSSKHGITKASGFLSTIMSNSSSTMSYSALAKGMDKISDETAKQAVSNAYKYCIFGLALRDMGFDNCGYSLTGGIINKVLGNLMYGVFRLSQIVPSFYNAIFSMLQKMNPFQFLADAHAYGSTKFDALIGNQKFDSLSNSYVVETLSDIYGTIKQFGFVGIIVAGGLALGIGLILGQLHKVKSAIVKFALRVFCIFAAVPLLAMLYTELLGMLSNITLDMNEGPSKMILCTFVDFEDWALEKSLEMPDATYTGLAPMTVNGAKSTEDSGDDLNASNLKRYCFAINKFVLEDEISALGSMQPPGKTNDASSLKNDSKTFTEDGENAHLTTDDIARISELILSYAHDEKISALGYSQTQDISMSSTNSEATKKFAESTSSNEDLYDSNMNSNIDSIKNYYAFNLSDGKGLTAVPVANKYKFKSEGPAFSPLAMYSFLNTKFDKSQLIAYSNENSGSDITKGSHSCVNIIGSGLLGMLYYFHALAYILATVIIGIIYGFGIFFGGLRRTFEMIKSLPFTVIGSFKHVVKLLVLILCVFVETMGTLFLMYVVFAVLDAIQNDFITAATSSSTGVEASSFISNITNSSVYIEAMLLVSIAFDVVIVIFAIKQRKNFLQAIEEWIESVVSKLFSTNANVNRPGDITDFHRGASNKKGSGPFGGVGNAIGAGMMYASMANKGSGIDADSDIDSEDESIDETDGGNESNGIEPDDRQHNDGRQHNKKDENNVLSDDFSGGDIDGEEYGSIEQKDLADKVSDDVNDDSDDNNITTKDTSSNDSSIDTTSSSDSVANSAGDTDNSSSIDSGDKASGDEVSNNGKSGDKSGVDSDDSHNSTAKTPSADESSGKSAPESRADRKARLDAENRQAVSEMKENIIRNIKEQIEKAKDAVGDTAAAKAIKIAATGVAAGVDTVGRAVDTVTTSKPVTAMKMAGEAITNSAPVSTVKSVTDSVGKVTGGVIQASIGSHLMNSGGVVGNIVGSKMVMDGTSKVVTVMSGKNQLPTSTSGGTNKQVVNPVVNPVVNSTMNPNITVNPNINVQTPAPRVDVHNAAPRVVVNNSTPSVNVQKPQGRTIIVKEGKSDNQTPIIVKSPDLKLPPNRSGGHKTVNDDE